MIQWMTQEVTEVFAAFIWKHKYTDSLSDSVSLISSVAINDSRCSWIIAEQHIWIPLWPSWWLFRQHALTCGRLIPVSICLASPGRRWLRQGAPARGSAPAATDLRAGKGARQRKRQGERREEGVGQPVLSVHPGAADPECGQRNAGQAFCHLQWSRLVSLLCRILVCKYKQENPECKTTQVLIMNKTPLLVWNLRLFQNKKNNKQGSSKSQTCQYLTHKVLLFPLLYLFFLDCYQTVDVSSCALSLIQLFKCELISARLVVIICGGKQEEAGRHRTWWMAGGGREVRGTDVMCGKRTVRREEAGYRLTGRRTIGGARDGQEEERRTVDKKRQEVLVWEFDSKNPTRWVWMAPAIFKPSMCVKVHH